MSKILRGMLQVITPCLLLVYFLIFPYFGTGYPIVRTLWIASILIWIGGLVSWKRQSYLVTISFSGAIAIFAVWYFETLPIHSLKFDNATKITISDRNKNQYEFTDSNFITSFQEFGDKGIYKSFWPFDKGGTRRKFTMLVTQGDSIDEYWIYAKSKKRFMIGRLGWIPTLYVPEKTGFGEFIQSHIRSVVPIKSVSLLDKIVKIQIDNSKEIDDPKIIEEFISYGKKGQVMDLGDYYGEEDFTVQAWASKGPIPHLYIVGNTIQNFHGMAGPNVFYPEKPGINQFIQQTKEQNMPEEGDDN